MALAVNPQLPVWRFAVVLHGQPDRQGLLSMRPEDCRSTHNSTSASNLPIDGLWPGQYPRTQFLGWKYVRLAARGPPTDWGWFVQADDAKAIFQVSPATLPMIDIHRP